MPVWRTDRSTAALRQRAGTSTRPLFSTRFPIDLPLTANAKLPPQSTLLSDRRSGPAPRGPRIRRNTHPPAEARERYARVSPLFFKSAECCTLIPIVSTFYSCCSPSWGPENDWYTRTLRCSFNERCDLDSVTLQQPSVGKSEKVKAVDISPVKEGALVCAPRYSRKLAATHLDTSPRGGFNYLSEWIKHYAERDFSKILLYADDCLSDVLTPKILAEQASGSGADVSIVDISEARDVPVWYHNQLLAMRDCWARGVAGGARWSASLDLDEFLVVSCYTLLSGSDCHSFRPAVEINARLLWHLGTKRLEQRTSICISSVDQFRFGMSCWLLFSLWVLFPRVPALTFVRWPHVFAHDGPGRSLQPRCAPVCGDSQRSSKVRSACRSRGRCEH